MILLYCGAMMLFTPGDGMANGTVVAINATYRTGVIAVVYYMSPRSGMCDGDPYWFQSVSVCGAGSCGALTYRGLGICQGRECEGQQGNNSSNEDLSDVHNACVWVSNNVYS